MNRQELLDYLYDKYSTMSQETLYGIEENLHISPDIDIEELSTDKLNSIKDFIDREGSRKGSETFREYLYLDTDDPLSVNDSNNIIGFIRQSGVNINDENSMKALVKEMTDAGASKGYIGAAIAHIANIDSRYTNYNEVYDSVMDGTIFETFLGSRKGDRVSEAVKDIIDFSDEPDPELSDEELGYIVDDLFPQYSGIKSDVVKELRNKIGRGGSRKGQDFTKAGFNSVVKAGENLVKKKVPEMIGKLTNREGRKGDCGDIMCESEIAGKGFRPENTRSIAQGIVSGMKRSLTPVFEETREGSRNGSQDDYFYILDAWEDEQVDIKTLLNKADNLDSEEASRLLIELDLQYGHDLLDEEQMMHDKLKSII